MTQPTSSYLDKPLRTEAEVVLAKALRDLLAAVGARGGPQREFLKQLDAAREQAREALTKYS